MTSSTPNPWQSQPTEIRDRILDSTDILTQYLNNYGRYQHHLIHNSPQLSIDVWKTALTSNWDGPLSNLPRRYIPTIHNGLDLVKNRSMYLRLCEAFPEDVWEYTTFEPCDSRKRPELPDDFPAFDSYYGLIHIAMRNEWFDLIGLNNICPFKLYEWATSGVHWKLFEHLRVEGFCSDHESFNELMRNFVWSAARHGYLDLLKELHAMEVYDNDFTREAMDYAAYGGHLDVVKFLRENRGEGCSNLAQEYASFFGYFDIFVYIHDQYPVYGVNSGSFAAIKGGSLRIFEYICNHSSYTIKPYAVRLAAEFNALDILRLMYTRAPELFTPFVISAACSLGHLEVVKFLHELDLAGWSTSGMDAAGFGGSLELVKFLHENRSEGCTTRAMNNAASSGFLDIVEFLHKNRTEGCTVEAVDFAAQDGYLEVVKFLMENRTEGCTVRAFLTPFPEVQGYLKGKCLEKFYVELVEILEKAVKERDWMRVQIMWRLFDEVQELSIDHLVDQYQTQPEVLEETISPYLGRLRRK
jgi:hypothetical protein